MDTIGLPFTLDGLGQEDPQPLYRQIHGRFRVSIAQGHLPPGARIMSARALAAQLGVARGTVEAAYALLEAEGYVEARGQAGTRVSPRLALPHLRPAISLRAPAPMQQAPAAAPFELGLPALDAFPRQLWARVGAARLRATQAADMAYPDLTGQAPLRAAIAAYLRVSRGIDCTPQQVIVTSGYRNSLDLVMRALLRAGDAAWVEDPGFAPTSTLLRGGGVHVVPVPVDHEGLQVEQGRAIAPQARMAVVTPSHQSPLCMSLSLPRRQALLAWASAARAWIVEDDYDGEYRYVGKPLAALQQLDRDGRVLYAGTFSKVLFPAIRLAYLVVPAALAELFAATAATCMSGPPALLQSIVTDFITGGHFVRHIQKMRKLYALRRDTTAAGLMLVLGQHLHAAPQPGGMHLVLRLRGAQSDHALAARMRGQGMAAQALSDLTQGAPGPGAILLGFTNVASSQEAIALGMRIKALL
jgi:GntR family transcriptional regulator / MocR family aminotransferase